MKKLGLMMLALLQVACAGVNTSNGEKYYLKSRNGVNLVVPEPLSSANISHFYDLPPQTQDAHVSIVPPA